MLTIKNIDKIITHSFVLSNRGTIEHWEVNDIDLMVGVYDINIIRKLDISNSIKRTIRIQREKNELGMYSVQIIQAGRIIDKDQIRLRNIKTAEGMLGELKTIMQFI